jgi:hypothetical protein
VDGGSGWDIYDFEIIGYPDAYGLKNFEEDGSCYCPLG